MTQDVTARVEAHIKEKIARYPADSLSPREVLTTLMVSSNHEDYAFKLNSTLTATIYQKAAEYAKQQAAIPKPRPGTFKAVASIDFSKNASAEHQAYLQQLTSDVLAAASTNGSSQAE